MRDEENVFHLAIPCRDLEEAREFYVEKLGCRLARRGPDRVNLDFFGDQLVCHLSPDEIEDDPQMYPRHFGVTFLREVEFDATHSRAKSGGAEFFQERFVRFADLPEEHAAFFLKDPSNNLIEFKHYKDPAYMY